MGDKAGIALDVAGIVGIVMDAMTVHRQSGIAKEQCRCERRDLAGVFVGARLWRYRGGSGGRGQVVDASLHECVASVLVK